jgi:hypothetical protein
MNSARASEAAPFEGLLPDAGPRGASLLHAAASAASTTRDVSVRLAPAFVIGVDE